MSRCLYAAALLWAALPAAAAPAPPAPPKPTALPVPAGAVVVAQLNGLDRTVDRLKAMAKAAAPDQADKVDAIGGLLDLGLGGRDRSALPADGRLYLAVLEFADDDGRVPVAAFLPTGSYAAFRDKLLTADERKSFAKGADRVDTFVTAAGQTYYAVDLTAAGGYVAVAADRAAVAPVAGKYDPLAPAAMGADVADAFLSADLAVWVNMARVNDDFGARIGQFRQLIQAAVDQGLAVGGGLAGGQKDAAKEGMEVLFQAAEDARGLAVGLEFRPAGLNLRFQLGFAADTATARGLVGEAPTADLGLAAAPAGLASYTAVRVGPKAAAVMARSAAEFAPPDDGDDALNRLIATFTALEAASAEAGGWQAANVPATAVGGTTPPDPAAHVAAKLAVCKALPAGGRYANIPLKAKPAVAEAAHKLAGFTFHEVTLDLDFEAAVEAIPDDNMRAASKASAERMLLPKPGLWFGTDGKRMIEATAKDWPTAEKLISDYLAGDRTVGKVGAFRAARDQLPAEASIVSLTDVAAITRLMADGVKAAAAAFPAFPGGELPPLKPAVGDPAFLGMAVVLRPAAVRFDLFVPADGVRVARGMVKPLVDKLTGGQDE